MALSTISFSIISMSIFPCRCFHLSSNVFTNEWRLLSFVAPVNENSRSDGKAWKNKAPSK
ncbi:hypothetical protein PanWU01x14_069920 [Parasponia andersonii]|uniref:Uncharacterized protein n=1 Tax=Parasponia andersonii TaxID=3476 RepID=A0A2P5DET3_PARAD|nr:hypothetical protein PanWU01x14_069920 [Parasponia andersonii]